QRKVQIRSGSETDHPDPLAARHSVAGTLGADDPPGHDAGHLGHAVIAAGGPDDDVVMLILAAGPSLPGGAIAPRSVTRLLHHPLDRRTIDVAVECRQEDRHARPPREAVDRG